MSEEAEPVASLGATLRRGAALSGAAFVVVQVIAFVQMLVIARLLSPDEVGIYAAGTVLTGFLMLFAENGMASALIHTKRDLDDAADTVFRASLAAGAATALLTLAAAPAVGWFFGSHTAGVVAAIVSGTLLLHAFTIVPDALMQRRFDFRRRIIVNPCYTLAFATTAIVLAALGWSVWALVVGEYVSYVVWIVLTWGLARWRPGRGRPTIRLWRELARFAYPLVISNAAYQLRQSFEVFVVGRGLEQAALGNFRYGRRLSMLPATAVVEIGSYVLFPAFARIADDADRLRAAYLRALAWIWYAVVPVAGMMVALGEPAVVVLLGDRWRTAGMALAVLAGYGLGEALCAVGAEAIKGHGRTRLLNHITGANLASGVVLLLLLVQYGLVGVGVAISASSLLMGVIAIELSRRLVGVGPGDIARRTLPALAGGAVATVAIWLLDRRLVHADGSGFAAGVGLLVTECIAFAVVYLAAMALFAPSMTGTVLRAARNLAFRQWTPSGSSGDH